MRWEACARTAVQRPWHYIARCFIALAVLAAFADGRHGSDVPAAASTDSAGGEREDVSRKIAIWRSRSGREATAAGSSDTVRLSTYRPRLHEAPLSAEEASARLRRWRAGVGKAPPTLSTEEGKDSDKKGGERGEGEEREGRGEKEGGRGEGEEGAGDGEDGDTHGQCVRNGMGGASDECEWDKNPGAWLHWCVPPIQTPVPQF